MEFNIFLVSIMLDSTRIWVDSDQSKVTNTDN